jgi:hypothetical protein
MRNLRKRADGGSAIPELPQTPAYAIGKAGKVAEHSVKPPKETA